MSKADVLRIPDYLEHIVEAIERIHLYIEDMNEVAFLNDQKTQDAVIRNFEIIGEASHKSSAITPHLPTRTRIFPGPSYMRCATV